MHDQVTMPSFSCPDPWWKDGYISQCPKDAYFAFLFPIAAVLFSICLLCLRQVCGRRQYRRPFPAHDTIIPTNDNHGSRRAIQPYNVSIYSRRMQIVETIVIAVDIIGFSAVLFGGFSTGPYGSLWLSVYLFVLSLARHHGCVSSIGFHRQYLYLVQWVCILVVAHETLLTSVDTLTRLTILFRLGLYTGLIVIHWTTPRRPPSYKTGDSSSMSPGETASPFSWLLFTWVDGLLWKAFRTGTLQGTDMFPLNQRLASGKITSKLNKSTKFFQVSLIRRVFRVLMVDFMRQGAWATVTSVLVFVPPFLIKLILEYLEQPYDVVSRRNVWMYVFGLLAGSLAAGIADCHCNCRFCPSMPMSLLTVPSKDTSLQSVFY